MKKLFISYRSSDHQEVDYIAKQLRSIKDANGDAKYETWQDKHDLKAGKSWWDGIIEAIIDCDVFVFNLSPAYFASDICRAELKYARERNRPVIPVVLESAYYINPKSNKPDIKFWGDLPEWVGNYQLLFFNEDDFLERFEHAIAEFEEDWPQDIEVRPPLNPDTTSVHGSTFAVYKSATDYAMRLAFDDAKPLFRELVTRNDPHFEDICRQWLGLIDRYEELLEAKQQRAPRAVFKNLWDAYTAQFPLDFVVDLYPDSGDTLVIFDPKNLGKQAIQRKKKPQATSPTTASKPSSASLMPTPFNWIEIPGKGYSITKYPVTNMQFANFIEAGGYTTERWWTKLGWQRRNEGWQYAGNEWKVTGTPWTAPRQWNNTLWNGALQPVVGVSWFEAVAFCQWLSETTGENIMLPTEDQWQYAAQGDDGRTYPWGNEWNRELCNNSVQSTGHGKTTPVTQYEGKGDSPFGVVDMAGNAWEWCLTDFHNKTNDIHSLTQERVVRGGSWRDTMIETFACDFRQWNYPITGRGFRLSKSG